MNAALERVNDDADRIDDRDQRDRARRAKAARDLRHRCAPYKAVRDLDELPAPVPVVGLSELACAILALVAHFVSRGAAGLQVGKWELVYRYESSMSSVKRALTELRGAGWMVATHDYVPASETKMLGPYVTRSGGKYRSLRSDDPEAHDNSQVRNLYTLGSKAIAAGMGKRCEQVGVQTPEPPDGPATFSASDSGSGSDSGFLDPDGRRPCGFVNNPRVGPEIEGSAPSARSTLAKAERDGDSLLEAARALDALPPPVADRTLALVDVDAGDARGNDGESARRGLFGAMGWRLSRFFRGGES